VTKIEDEIERLVREASDKGAATSEPVQASIPRQSFRIVGGVDSASVAIGAASNTAVKKVVAVAIRPERYLVSPVSDIPVDGYSIAEDGYDRKAAKARVEMLLGPDSHLGESVWLKAQSALDAGRGVAFTRESRPIDFQGKQVFPIRITV